MNVRSVRNEDCESGYVRSRPYIPICEPEGRDRVEKENRSTFNLVALDIVPVPSDTEVLRPQIKMIVSALKLSTVGGVQQ